MITVLLEGRDAHIYHCTSIYNAYKILDSDKLKPVLRASKVTGDTSGSISFTRDKNYSVSSDAMIQLTFDQRKLSQRYKIVPIAEPGFCRESGWTESEERLITNKPIKVSDYLISIDVTPEFESDLKSKLNYLIDTPRARWDHDDKSVHTLWYWWQVDEFKFGPRITRIFNWFEDLLRR